ncbi:MAG: ACP S-malonyltransferase, partial [Anaerolineales bacterium]|nr:ACP S-malonyltransferase [Anaerolineales bacterium]
MKINLSTTAFVFPGQGSQTIGMGKELAEAYPIVKQTFEEADAILGFALSKLMTEGASEELNETINTQPALFLHSMAAFRAFTHLHPDLKPALLAGHSLGELSALAAAGALSFADGLRLVRKRGELMKRAGELAPGGMAAILGVDIPTLDAVCASASAEGELVQVANDNCPGQVVISGAKAAVERAMSGAKAAGAKRAVPLAVSIAAHSPLMDSIQTEWNDAVNQANFSALQIPVVGNVHAQPLAGASAARADLMDQMQSRVRWTESVKYMSAQGINTY